MDVAIGASSGSIDRQWIQEHLATIERTQDRCAVVGELTLADGARHAHSVRLLEHDRSTAEPHGRVTRRAAPSIVPATAVMAR
ncbi:MAG: hypothetical protein EA387_00265 [Nitriliruptor sp.]|nr:MAG: hypothetical protein EA387_00265 [Nitriliruptor sp.]